MLGTSAVEADIVLTPDERLLMNNALNEVCNGFAVKNFQGAIGATRERARELLRAIGSTFEEMRDGAAPTA